MDTKTNAKHNIGTTHREVLGWVKKAAAGEELRAAKGLYLRKTEGGAFWVYRYRSPVTGKQVRAQLWADDERGVVGFPDASLEEAMTRAAALRAKVADGIDPVLAAEQARQDAEQAAALERQRLADEQRQREADAQAAALAQARRLTVRSLAEKWQTEALTRRTLKNGDVTGRKDGGKQSIAQFHLHAFDLVGDLPIELVRKSDILAVVDRLMAAGKQRVASMVLGDFRQMFAWAAERDLVASDPTASIKRSKHVGKEVARERVLSPDELRQLGPAIASARLTQRSAAGIWLALATGVRVGELLGAAWADDLPTDPKPRTKRLDALQALADAEGLKLGIVDTKARTWHLPDSKNGRDHTIHLSDFALVQLDKLAALREQLTDTTDTALSPWIFPARDNHRPVIVTSFGKQLADRQREPERVLSKRTKAAGTLALTGGKWTPHDLRRTAASLMAELGITGDVIDECLNHLIASKVRRTYIRNRREADQMRAFDALGKRLEELTTGAAGGSNVVSLRVA